jgi:hypothetical protein
MLKYCRSPLLCLFPVAAFILMLCPTWLLDLQMSMFNVNPMNVEFVYDVNKMIGTVCMIVSFVLMIPSEKPSSVQMEQPPTVPEKQDDGSTEDTTTSLSHSSVCNREKCRTRQDNNNMSESDNHSHNQSQSNSRSDSRSHSRSDSRSYSYNLRPNTRRMNSVSMD